MFPPPLALALETQAMENFTPNWCGKASSIEESLTVVFTFIIAE